MMLLRLFFVVLLTGTGLSGCTTPGRSLPDRPVGYVSDPALTPAHNLERFAVREEGDANLASPEVDLPPGLEPSVLALRSPDDPRAWLTLGEAISQLADLPAAISPAPTEPRREIEPPAELAALRHYAKGREAALEGRHHVAITEFHRAMELDPYALPVMRELARSHLALGNVGRATELYSQIVQLDPDHSEAIFSIALQAAHRRDWEGAAAKLARRYQASSGASGFDHDRAADALAWFTFASAMRSLGYDRASIEAARNASNASASIHIDETMYGGRLASLHRQQSELWRSIGDAHCRLGEFGAAIDAYAISAVLPAADPSALHPRVIYANLRLGRAYTAQYELLAVMKSQGESISDRDIRLCAYLADHVEDVELLRDAMLQLHSEHGESSPGLARATAALLPSEQAGELLREFVRLHPRDVRVVGELLAWMSIRHPQSAVEAVVGLIETNPDLAGEYVSRLVFTAPRSAEMINSARALPPSPASANLLSRALIAVGALGEAWSTCAQARVQWPREPGLLWLQLEMSALLEEPALLRDLLQTDLSTFDDPLTWMFRARAHRGLGQVEQAVEAAERGATEMLRQDAAEIDPSTPAVLLERAMAYYAYAVTRGEDSERRKWASEAAIVAEQVIQTTMQRQQAAADGKDRTSPYVIESAYELLFTLYGPSGPLRDPQRLRDFVQELSASIPGSRLYARLSAEELIAQGRYEQALERLLNLYDSDPADNRALSLAVEAWSRGEQHEAAREWLSEKLQRHPGDPALLEQWATVMMRLERADDAIAALAAMADDEPRNYAAIRLIESAYRATGQMDKAFTYGEKRLMALPHGVRRDIELAALYGGVGMEGRAFTLLEDSLERVDDATFEHLVTALSILSRLETETEHRAQLTMGYATHIAQRFPQAPMQIFALGLGAMAKLDILDQRFDDFAQLAVQRMPENAEQQVTAAWRDLAQALINAGEFAAAARTLRLIVRAEHLLDLPMTGILLTMAVVADAAAGEEAQRAEETVALIEELAAAGRLPVIFGMEQGEEPTIAKTLYYASQTYSILGNEMGVEVLLRRSIAINPNDAMVLNNLGYMLIERGHDDDETIAWIERAHELEPENAHILDTIGWLRYRQGMFEDEEDRRGAMSLIEAAMDATDEPVAEVYDHLGDAYCRVDRHSEAIEMWEKGKAVLADPSHRQSVTQNLQLLQVRGWGLVVADPQEMYDRLYGNRLDRLRGKLDAAGHGEQPDITPTFDELKHTR